MSKSNANKRGIVVYRLGEKGEGEGNISRGTVVRDVVCEGESEPCVDNYARMHFGGHLIAAHAGCQHHQNIAVQPGEQRKP